MPLELASETAALSALYRQVVPQTSVVPQKNAGVLVARREVRDGILMLAVSESSSEQQVTLEPNRAGVLLLGNDGTKQRFGGFSSARSHVHSPIQADDERDVAYDAV